MKVYPFFILFILIISSCINNKSDSKTASVKLNLFQMPKELDMDNNVKFNLSEIYSKIDGITLDLDGGAIGGVNKVLVFEHTLFVFDSQHAKKIFAYDLQQGGKFLYSIGIKGKGPGEFLQMNDFTIDSLNQQLLIIDSQQRKILYFNLKGKFVREQKLKFIPLKICCNNDYLYFFSTTYSSDDFGVKITDRALNVLKEYLPYKDYPTLTNYDSGFLKTENKLLFNYPNCDTIFQFNDLSIKPYLAIESGEKSFCTYAKENSFNPKNSLFHFIDIMKGKEKDFENILLPGIYFEDNKLQLFNFKVNSQHWRFITNKANKDALPTIGRLYNDYFFSTISPIGYHKYYGTIGVVRTERMLSAKMEWVEKHKKSISPKLVQTIKEAAPNDNPYIIFLK